MEEKNITYCKKCLMPSTRPRITFNSEGICNGCEWHERKKTEVDWKARWKELEGICDKYRCNDGSNWDVIVPCSGGKDSYHIAWNMKHKLKMHPLLIRFAPMIPTALGERNWKNLADQGFDLMEISPNRKIYAALGKKGLFEQGRAWIASESGITTALLRVAIGLKIPFLIYGEEGEAEYGGRKDMQNKTGCKRQWIVDTYWSGFDTKTYEGGQFTKHDLKLWQMPAQEELDKHGIFYAHWSYFENWSTPLHYETAKRMEFQAQKSINVDEGCFGYSTYCDYQSLDDCYTRSLHTYLMFLKFGFGIGTQMSSADIKAGEMTREEGIEAAKKYDSYDCFHFKDKLLKFYNLTNEEWDQIVDKWANRDILKKISGKWVLKHLIY